MELKLTDEQMEKLGELVAEMVAIDKVSKELYATSWGFKTELGLGASVLRLVNEVLRGYEV